MSNQDKMKPILLNTQMVKAILDGSKTQTRRVVKDFTRFDISREGNSFNLVHNCKCCIENVGLFSSIEKLQQFFINKYGRYQKGDILYVRETFVIGVPDGTMFESKDNPLTIFYKADDSVHGWVGDNDDEVNVPWKPSIHMPKKYARIFLKVTNVRVERLQDITFNDIAREGYDKIDFIKNINHEDIAYKCKAKNAITNPEKEVLSWWIELWDSTAPKDYKWEDNPCVFVHEFERVEK